MSYSLWCLVLGAKEKIELSDTKHFTLESTYYPYSFKDIGYEASSLMQMGRGMRVELFNIKHLDGAAGALCLCEADWDYPKESIKYPDWVNMEAADYDLVPLIIFDEYLDEFKRIMQFLINKSPIGKMMFLARFQGCNEDVVCGTIQISDFFTLLSQKRILFNVCYILIKDHDEDYYRWRGPVADDDDFDELPTL